MAVSSDGSKIKMKWLTTHGQKRDRLSLNELLRTLENYSSTP
jgi:hypothetical protein